MLIILTHVNVRRVTSQKSADPDPYIQKLISKKTILIMPSVYFQTIKRKVVPVRHEGAWRSIAIVPLILNLSTRRSQWTD
jgi:hypothetical protein